MGIKVYRSSSATTNCNLDKSIADLVTPWFVQFDLMIPSSTFTFLSTTSDTAQVLAVFGDGASGEDVINITAHDTGGGGHVFSSGNKNYQTFAPLPAAAFTADAWHVIELEFNGTNAIWKADGTTIFNYANDIGKLQEFVLGKRVAPTTSTSEVYYFDNFKVGTSAGASDIFGDNFESGFNPAWDSTCGTIVDDPLGTGGPSTGGGGGTVTADFTASPLSGPAPLTVAFTDLSTGSPTSWAWDFGDGGTSTVQNPTHVYTTVGAMDVSLTASN